MIESKKRIKVVVLDFEENSYYTQDRENVTLLGPKSTYFNFSLSLLIKFFLNLRGFFQEILKNCILNEKFNPKITTIRAFFSPKKEKMAGETSSLPPLATHL